MRIFSDLTVKKGGVGSVTKQMGKDLIFMDVEASEDTDKTPKSILVKFSVGKIGSDGHRKILFKPEINAKANEPVELSETIKLDTGPQTLAIALIAKQNKP
jgi:hypothetical protein